MDPAKRERLKNWLKPGGPPPPDSPHRCSASSSTTGFQCRQWAMRGTVPPLCKHHGGRTQLRSRGKDTLNRTIGKLSVAYRNLLSPALRSLVDEQLEQDPDEQASILEELALMRTFTAAFVTLYSKAHDLHATEPSDSSMAKLFAAGQAMSGALEQVGKLAEQASRIQVKQKDRFNLQDMRYVVDTIILIIHEECDGDDAIAARIAKGIQDRLKLPTGYGAPSDQGTELHPADTIAIEFDQSIPTGEGNAECDVENDGSQS